MSDPMKLLETATDLNRLFPANALDCLSAVRNILAHVQDQDNAFARDHNGEAVIWMLDLSTRLLTRIQGQLAAAGFENA
jgi:hypothetical protein